MKSFTISGQLIDILAKETYPCTIQVENGVISSVQRTESADPYFIIPGFIDAHVHVESSMLVPSEFARLAVVHGTVATVSDPHEIGNVLGTEGVKYMIENGRKTPFKFAFGAPSCVPATTFETAGATIDAEGVRDLLEMEEIRYLAEMMNWPGVLYGDEEVYKKIAAAKELGKPVDGHAPGLKGEQAKKYIEAGISTDHECFTAEEALDKLKYGMKILIREGSAARNFEALADLLHEHYDSMMLCSDDKHPDNLVEGHINTLCARAVAKGIDSYKVLQAACINPATHYNLPVGLLKKGDPADFVMLHDLESFRVHKTYIDGDLVAEEGKTLIPRVDNEIINHFSCELKSPDDFSIKASGQTLNVIEAMDGQLITNRLQEPPRIENGLVIADTDRDILKLTVVNRYQDADPAISFIRNFGLKNGALASCVGHDSHNIIAVGCDDEAIAQAVNLVIKNKGGISAVGRDEEMVLPLPVAGIMSADDGYEVARQYSAIDKFSKSLGSELESPFMTLSFMALLVIPSVKLSDKGLFDGDKFAFIEPFAS
ncbi:adenine deaminase [Roseivirga sp. BDSF3-8]|uniref:adenine deaminase n=1 Tax=Roseivirga sp. BDSF3-8 TaxID=3241598 RepID=UPI0035319345